MKKAISLIISVLLAAGSVSVSSFAGTEPSDSGRIQIVTTIFPESDWVMNILGDNSAGADVTMLLDTGVDLHSFQPTAADILKISTCDLFIYVGGESDEWVDDALQEATNKNMTVINLLDVLGDAVKEEEVVEGMQEEEEADGQEADGGECEIEYDEHIWLSLKNADASVKAIAEILGEIDPKNTATYKANADAYGAKLTQLDKEYQETTDRAAIKTLVFADRFPFAYLFRDYGLTHHAAFTGCSAETEASFATISMLAQKVDELKLRAVMVIETSDQSIARTVVQNTKTKDQEILTMDSIQSVTQKRIDAGETYLNIMENNLKILKNALATEIKLWLN